MLQFLRFFSPKIQKKEYILDGEKIAYVSQQKSNAPVYVFLHGWGSSLDVFSEFFSREDNYFAFDFPGHGGSFALQKSWKLKDFAEITQKILKKKGGGKKIIFVVHSFGGRVLLKMLSENSSFRIEHIIYIGVPFVREVSTTRSALSLTTKLFGTVASVLPKKIQKRAKKIWYSFLPHLDYSHLQSEEQKKTFQNIVSETLDPYFSVFKTYTSTFIWGEDDDMAPLSLVQPLAKKYNIPLFVIPHVGHFPFIGRHKKAFFEKFQEVVGASIHRAQKRTP